MSSARKFKNGLKQKLSIEMLLRKSFCDSFKDYVQHCSLAGVKQTCNSELTLLTRLLWSAVFLTSLSTVCYFLQYTWFATLTKPFIVTMESSEHPIGSIDFPAVAICNINRISKKALKKLALKEYEDIAHKESLDEVQNILLNLGRLIDYSYNESQRNHPVFENMIEKYRSDTSRIVDIMKKLAPSCDEMLLQCAWAGEIVNCDKIFTMHRTANRGHCCIFNYVLSYNSFTRPAKLDMDVKRQQLSGELHGLNVIMDPLLDDYAYPLSGIRGFDILLFDSMHFADPSAGRVVHRMSEPNAAVLLELKSTKQIATKEVRKYALETRKCLFHDELKEHFSNMYSYSTCIVFCRIMTIQSLCKCTPYFIAGNQKETRVCTLEDLKCLNKYREKLYYLYPFDADDVSGLETELEDSLMCPNCYPDCEMTQHRTKCIESPFIINEKKVLKDFFFESVNLTDKCVLSIYHPSSDATFVKLDVVYYWYEVLSNVGGFCGIIVGFSIITLIEIIYFFSIRFLQNLYANYKKYR